MQVLTQEIDVAAFLESLPLARQRVLMFDYDGTLAPFCNRPEMARPYAGVPLYLDALMQNYANRVVIVSGRRAQDLPPLLRLAKQPEIWGANGWECLLPDGSLHTRRPADRDTESLRKAALIAEEARRFGARLEYKPASVALHWRGLPALAIMRIRRWATDTWLPQVRERNLEPMNFDGGVEVRTNGAHKQFAVSAILSGANGSAAAYFGGDFTDEEAFTAVKQCGIAVLVRDSFRRTAADVWIRPRRELLSFLGRWCVSAHS